MEANIWMNASEVSRTLGVSESKAYKVIKELNEELKEKGYLTIAGKVSRKFFQEKYYGYEPEDLK